jgi:hypothetical protein
MIVCQRGRQTDEHPTPSATMRREMGLDVPLEEGGVGAGAPV